LALALLAVEQGVPGNWRSSAPVRFVEVFGMSSLAGYFFHEMLLFFRIFGFSFESRWGKACSWPQYAALTALLAACTFALTWLTKGKVGTPTHVAFHAQSAAAVDAFYRAAMAAGGKDNGAPGPRDEYGYAAFVLDPDGHNVEAVIWDEEMEKRRRSAPRRGRR